MNTHCVLSLSLSHTHTHTHHTTAHHILPTHKKKYSSLMTGDHSQPPVLPVRKLSDKNLASLVAADLPQRQQLMQATLNVFRKVELLGELNKRGVSPFQSIYLSRPSPHLAFSL
jgi:hypothetical protein